jgi:polyvinyl alcohol dehydrogenase (cytochrome)
LKLCIVAPVAAFVVAAAAAVLAQTALPGGERLAALEAKGESVFAERCAKCHDPAVGRAPDRAALAERTPGDIFRSLKTGRMAPMAAGLADEDIGAVAVYLSKRLGREAMQQAADPPACASKAPFSTAGSGWNGWSIDARNWRLQPNPGLSAKNVGRLKVKWAMTYVGGRYGQPAIVGGRLFLTSGGGKVYSLDARTGCLVWRHDVPAGARSTVVVGRLKSAPSGYAAFLGDFQRNVYALDAATGALVWKTNIETHPLSIITGSPALYEGHLYVPLSSYEETTTDAPGYECCTFRGALAALDAATGKLLWKTYAIAEAPHPTRKNSAGVQMFGPAGAAIWSAPTIDAKRGLVYVATGDSYTDEPQDGSDAVIAIDVVTGQVRWRRQVTEGDNFLVGCGGPRESPNCPTKLGPDHDFGASPILVTLPNGRDLVLAGQKSGAVFGLDPDRSGKVVWRTQVGAGGPLGGIEWGMAYDRRRLYVANADAFSPGGGEKPGLYALDPADGRIVWSAPAPKVACSFPAPPGRCLNAQSGPPTVTPGLVLATTMDGRLRAYDASDGKVLWTFDTAAQTYATINGVAKQSGGSLDATGPTLAGGMLFLISGYQGPIGGVADNVLLAFSVDGQ